MAECIMDTVSDTAAQWTYGTCETKDFQRLNSNAARAVTEYLMRCETWRGNQKQLYSRGVKFLLVEDQIFHFEIEVS